MKAKILGALAVIFLCGPLAAHAVQVTVGRSRWDVTSQTGTFTDLETTLNIQTWWADGLLALEFARALGDGLGFPKRHHWVMRD